LQSAHQHNRFYAVFFLPVFEKVFSCGECGKIKTAEKNGKFRGLNQKERLPVF